MSAINAEQLERCSTTGSIEETVSALIDVVQEQADRIDELEQRLEDEQTQRGVDDAELRGRIHDLEEQVESIEEGEISAETPTPDGEELGSKSSETPLERVCGLPEGSVDRELSANQRRARFVAKDVDQYASKVPAGYAITSGEISTVLRAGTDCNGRTQTVARVMEFLERFGRDEVTIVKRRGTKRVIFDESIVDRLEAVESVGTDHAGCDPVDGVVP